MTRVILSCAMSADGYLDDRSDARRVLSSPEDMAAMLRLRAEQDMIVIGAETLRRDNPSLATRGDENFARRAEQGRAPHPVKVVLSRSSDLPKDAAFFQTGDAPKIVLTPEGDMMKGIIDLARAQDCADVMIEGGASVLRQALQSGRATQWRLAISSDYLGEDGYGEPFDLDAILSAYPVLSDQSLGGTRVVTLDLTAPRMRDLIERAFDLSERCPPSETAFAVGAIACDETLGILATGYSRETGAKDHAEEALLSKLSEPPHTVICTLEPCLTRASKPLGCAQRLTAAGVKRVIFAVAEDETFTQQSGLAHLRRNEVELIQIDGFEERFRAVNSLIYGAA